MNPDREGESQSALEEQHKQKRIEIARRNYVEVGERLYKYGELLRSKYSNVEDYRLFHIMAGGTPPPECPKFDFPGEDSVVSFFEKLDKEFPEKSE